MNKYEMVPDENIIILDKDYSSEPIVLYRIRACMVFDTVSKGELGGFIESEDNLSQNGNCWIDSNSKVYGKSVVDGDSVVKKSIIIDSIIKDSASVSDSTIRNSTISGHSTIYDTTVVESEVSGSSKLYSNELIGDSEIEGSSLITNSTVERSVVRDKSSICDSSVVGSEISKSKLYSNKSIKLSEIENSSVELSIVDNSNVSNAAIENMSNIEYTIIYPKNGDLVSISNSNISNSVITAEFITFLNNVALEGAKIEGNYTKVLNVSFDLFHATFYIGKEDDTLHVSSMTYTGPVSGAEGFIDSHYLEFAKKVFEN